jgi:GAF domain-containing protein
LVVESTSADDGSVLSAGVLAESLRAAVARRTPEQSLRAVIEMAVGTAPCDQASITMLGPGRAVQTVASSDDRITKADLLQYDLDEGPCLDAVWTDGVFRVPDLVADARWPRWAPMAAGLGIGAMLAVHLYTDTGLGALNLYSERPRQFDGTDLEAARVVAAHASVVLAYARKTQDLWQAIDTRNLIGQAQGMLMARYGLTPDKAFAVLRRYFQTTSVRLAVLAEELTSIGRLPDLDPDTTP